MRNVALLIVAVFALAVPARSTPIDNEEVLRLLPADALLYAGVEDFRYAYDEAKKFVERVAPDSELFEELEGMALRMFEEMPERMREGVKTELKNLVSAHVVMVPRPQAMPTAIFLVRCAEAEPLKKFVLETLKEELSGQDTEFDGHAGVVFQPQQGMEWFATVVGGVAAVTEDRGLLENILARADGKEAPPSLKDSPHYERLSTRKAARVGAKLYVEIGRLFESAMENSPYQSGRYAAYHSDTQDAILGMSGLGGLWLDASLDAGNATARLEVGVGPEFRFYHEVWRQDAGPKEALKYVPREAAFALHANFESGEAMLEKLDRFCKRLDRVDAAQSPGRQGNLIVLG